MMRTISYTLLFAVAAFLPAPATSATGEPDLQQMWQLLQAQQAQIAELTDALQATRAELEATRGSVQETREQLVATADYVDTLESSDRSSATSIGGYGEMHYSNVDARDADLDYKEADFHRFVMFFGHEFNDRIRFFSEVELEHSLVEDTDDGSGAGEVELEQAFVEMDLDDHHYARAGLFLLPIGILNETHEPPTFYGVERNDVESIIIPSTWWEGGIGAGGRYGNGLSWDFAVHTGLEMPTAGGGAFAVRSGRQKLSEANADDLAYTLRLRYTGIPGLELAGSYHYQQDPTQLAGDGVDDGRLVSVHGIYDRGPFSLKALWARWQFDGAGIELADADEQTGWYVEPGLRIDLAGLDIGIYGRFEDVEGARAQDRFEQWQVGLSYWPIENVVFKLDYRDREHDLDAQQGRDFNAVDLGVGYYF
ncbi:MAG: porin [Pseudomonadales bacterium]